MIQNRREFISTIATAGAALPFASNFKTFSTEPAVSKLQVRLFSKPLDRYDFGFMCECLNKSGIEGFDLTVRPAGKIEPANVETELPKLIEEAKKYKLAVDMIVTGILTGKDPFAEKILKTAADSGVKYYRLGWYSYDDNIGVWDTLQRHRASFKDVVELNRKYKIHGGYQNHSDGRVGGPVWDLKELLRDFPLEYAGVQYDVRHAMVEGATSWIYGMRLISDHIKTLAIKDFTWITENGRPKFVDVPMGEGMVDWDLYFKTVKELNITGPITLHVEYPLFEKGEEKLALNQQQEILVRKIKKDMDFLKSYLQKYQLI
jgi:L-ribulose-5-phosphate 3-epimerase